jgi:uncharacterized membrane protein YbhN (UPF0104 family)
MTRRTVLLIGLKLAVSVAILGYIFARWVHLQDLAKALGRMDPAMFVSALALTLVVRWLLAAQFRQLAGWFGLKHTILGVMKAHLISSFFSTVAPGEIISSGVSWHYLARGHRAYGRVGGMLVFLKLVGYACLTAFALVALLMEPRLSALGLRRYAVIVAVACAVGLLALLHPGLVRVLLTTGCRLVERLPSSRLRTLAEHGLETFFSIHALSWRQDVVTVGYAVLINVAGALALGCLFSAAGVQVPWTAWFWLRAVITVIQAVPLSLAGTGVREVTLVYLLGALYHTDPTLTVAASLLILGVNLFYGLAVGGLLLLLDRGAPRPASAVTGPAQAGPPATLPDLGGTRRG